MLFTTLITNIALLSTAILTVSAAGPYSNKTNNEFSGLDPNCCDGDYPSQSKGIVYSLLTHNANVTGNTAFTPFPGIKGAKPWKWNMASVQLNSTVANGAPRQNTQFALATWLDAPGLWDDEGATWDDEIELCAAQITFFEPRTERERMGYNSTIPDSTVSEYGGCEAAFEKSECVQQVRKQIVKLYTEGGCMAVGHLVIDPKCAPNQGTIVKPFVVTKGLAGKEEFQQNYFDGSAGRKQGATLGNGEDRDEKGVRELFGSVVNEVRPLVLIGKDRKTGVKVDVRMACVKGETLSPESMRVVAGPDDEVAAAGGGRSVFGAVMGLAGVLAMGMM